MRYSEQTRLRFFSFVKTGLSTDECFEWTGAKDWDGYGIFQVNGASKRAHRMALDFNDVAIAGKIVDHKCRVRNCVNPKHLRVVTPRENSIENSESFPAINSRKTHCKNGHPFSENNLRMDSKGKRVCVSCYRHYHKLYERKRREEIKNEI